MDLLMASAKLFLRRRAARGSVSVEFWLREARRMTRSETFNFIRM
jgi:hypothetical protein